MKRLLLINDVNLYTVAMRGVCLKLEGQAKGLSQLGYHVSVLQMSRASIIHRQWQNGIEKSELQEQLIDNINLTDSDFFSHCKRWLYGKHYDLVITRYVPMLSSDSFLQLMQAIHIMGTRSVIEFPTIPYDQEIAKEKGAENDRKWREHLKHYVNNCLTSSEDTAVFGIAAQHFGNKIDCSEYDISALRFSQNSIALQLIGVARIAEWHGYDRLLRGIALYLDSGCDLPVRFHIVGEGPEKGHLETLASELNLVDYVVFHGMLKGEPLTKVFRQCHVGIGTLAGHRKGLKVDSSLKHREFCARGMPFIRAGRDLDFEGVPFCLKLPDDDEPISIYSIKRFLNGLAVNANDYREDIRNYAEQNLSWESEFNRLLPKMIAQQ